MTLQDVKDKLATFLKNNVTSSIVENDGGSHYWVKRLFGDTTVNLRFSDGDANIISALNRLHFPERFSALWHHETHRLEVIYTIFKPQGVLADRKFEFDFRGSTYSCSFDVASDDLTTVAGHFSPEGVSDTNHRNLSLFANYAAFLENNESIPAEQRKVYEQANPTSFWVDGLADWKEELVLDLVQHLNFYMTYYDRLTPSILVHSPADESRAHQPQPRLFLEKFPEHINCIEIDRDLLHFWQASRTGDPARRFLYNYQVIEYAAFYMIEDDISKAVTKLLATPHRASHSSSIAMQVMNAFGSSKMSDAQKIEHLMRKAVSPQVVWDALEPNREAFAEPTIFDGGYTAPVLIRREWKAEDFATNWPTTFANASRGVRNALSHGREQRMTSVITPTIANLRRLQAWVPAVAAVAREVMIYRHV